MAWLGDPAPLGLGNLSPDGKTVRFEFVADLPRPREKWRLVPRSARFELPVSLWSCYVWVRCDDDGQPGTAIEWRTPREFWSAR